MNRRGLGLAAAGAVAAALGVAQAGPALTVVDGVRLRLTPGLARVGTAGHAALTLDGLRRAREVVAEATGTPPRWFRPPYGVLTGAALLGAARLGLRPVLWTAWGRDWVATATPASILAELDAGRLDGGTLLLHDYAASGSWRATLAALAPLADLLAARGLAAGPLADHGLEDAAADGPAGPPERQPGPWRG